MNFEKRYQINGHEMKYCILNVTFKIGVLMNSTYINRLDLRDQDVIPFNLLMYADVNFASARMRLYKMKISRPDYKSHVGWTSFTYDKGHHLKV